MGDFDKKMKIVFAPGAFDHFDGTQEELDALVSELTNMVETGEFPGEMVHIDELPEDEKARLLAQLGILEEEDCPSQMDTTFPTWTLH